MAVSHLFLYLHIPQTELALRGPGGEKRDIHSLSGTCIQKCRMHFVQGFLLFFAFWCQECANNAWIYGAGKSPLILCKDLYYFLHSARSRSERFPGCLPPASRRASIIPKWYYFIRKMYISGIRYCKIAIFHKDYVYFQHSRMQNIYIS